MCNSSLRVLDICEHDKYVSLFAIFISRWLMTRYLVQKTVTIPIEPVVS